MAEPTIILEQRAVVRTVQVLGDEHMQEELEAENRLRLDRETADQSLGQARDVADAELRRAFEILQESDRLVQPRSGREPQPDVVPVAPPKMFDTGLLTGMRITTTQMEARLVRIRSSFIVSASPRASASSWPCSSHRSRSSPRRRRPLVRSGVHRPGVPGRPRTRCPG